MIIPSIEECERVIAEGELIGEGGCREVFAHTDYPGIVVKVAINTYGFWGDQNEAEAINYKYLCARGLPDNLRIPETVMVGEYVVQEFIDGDTPDDNRHDLDPSRCGCYKRTGLSYCWFAPAWAVCSDANSSNVVLVDNYTYLIDLGYGIRANAR